MSSKCRRFVPRLEFLNDRCVPAIVSLDGSTLSITVPAGDTTADQIVIDDYGPVVLDASGNYVSGGLTVIVDGALPEQVHVDVSAIIIDTGAGNDTVTYNLWAALSTTRLIGASLGKGADTFVADLHGNTLSRDLTTGAVTNLGITVNGDGGGDSMTLNAVGVTVAEGANLSVGFNGQAGKDSITFNIDPGFDLLPNVFLTKDQKH